MSTDLPSMPIATDSGCCSSGPKVESPFPMVSETSKSEGCCSEQQHTSIANPGTTAKEKETSATGDTGEAAAAETMAAPADEGVPPDDAALIDALRQVVDPELMINIVDLGLVYSINHTDRKVLVEMTLTSPACPAGPQIISQAKMSLEKLSGVDSAEIKLTMSPPWTPDRMTDDARDQLGIF